MSPLGWHAERIARHAGLPGWAAALLLLACLAGWLGAELPAAQRAQALNTEIEALELRLRDGGEGRAAAVDTPARQLERFRGGFGSAGDITASLAKLQSAAKRNALQLDQAGFKLAADAGEPLLRYSIELPVKADYRALRRFIRDALRDLPGMALEELSLRRGEAKSPVLEARLRFVLFVTRRD
ncbi:hypothetical protein [Methylibium sp.]|uniref:hypothetical protein n=1 Tax=Methylibium sp. TaxID=2067992 RepID=UPI003D0A6E30